MDPAEPNSVIQALASQGTLLGKHDQQLQSLAEDILAMSGQVSQICNQLTTISSQLSLSGRNAAQRIRFSSVLCGVSHCSDWIKL